MTEDSIDDDQQLQMALQMSLDEISMARSRNVSKSEDDSETAIPSIHIQDNAAKIETDIPTILPKY